MPWAWVRCYSFYVWEWTGSTSLSLVPCSTLYASLGRSAPLFTQLSPFCPPFSAPCRPQCPLLPGHSLEVRKGRSPRQQCLHQGAVGLCICPRWEPGLEDRDTEITEWGICERRWERVWDLSPANILGTKKFTEDCPYPASCDLCPLRHLLSII